MATRAAMAERGAALDKRTDTVVQALARETGIDLPPPFPTVHDPAFRALDEREWIAQVLERVLAAVKEND